MTLTAWRDVLKNIYTGKEAERRSLYIDTTSHPKRTMADKPKEQVETAPDPDEDDLDDLDGN